MKSKEDTRGLIETVSSTRVCMDTKLNLSLLIRKKEKRSFMR
jgi:hypothetical protein